MHEEGPFVDQVQYLGTNLGFQCMEEKDYLRPINPKEKEYTDTLGYSDYKMIEHPIHYTGGRKYEPWDVVEDWKLNYFAGTALKYISRYERKGEPVRDLKKAIEFLKREIVRLEKEKH